MSRSKLLTVWLTLCTVVGGPSTIQAQVTPTVLPIAEEIDLALSAAPSHLHAGAGVFAMTAAGYVAHRASSNGFTCLVNRDTPWSLKPTCFDAEGTATIIPKIVAVGDALLAGASHDDVMALVAEGFASGRFISPRRPGVAYMLSDRIVNANPRTGATSGFPPHVMFYAPNLTNDDIGVSGADRKADPTLPFIAYQGPHGYMVVVDTKDR